MQSELPKCDRGLLHRALDDSLSELQEAELARHLTECKVCQRKLELLAAEETEWSRVGGILQQEAKASRADATTGQTAEFQGPGQYGGDFQLAPVENNAIAHADFAVDFLEPSKTPQTLGRLGAIEIFEVLGHGGMGIVLRGFQRELNRPVAVKVLAPHLATSGAARQRFAREAQATAVIVHPNVMPILTVHSAGKLPHLVMPYVACESLQQRLDRDGPLATVDVLRIGMQVASGLAAAHAQGLVHRDVKPANVLLEKGVDRAMLTDFGLARAVDDASLTRTGVIAGTPQFMSPEQARGDSIDPRSDLFSLGSVMYAMSTGRPPFRAETSYGILRRITDTEPRDIRDINPDVPGWLVAMIRALHAKDPAERFQSAEELAKQLEACVAHVQQPTAIPLPSSVQSRARQALPHDQGSGAAIAERLRRFGKAATQRRGLLASGIAAGLLVVASVVGMVMWDRKGDNHGGTSSAPVPTVKAAPEPAELATSSALATTAWHDGTAQRIFDLTRATERLETATASFWTDPSPSSPPTHSVTTMRTLGSDRERCNAPASHLAATIDRRSPTRFSDRFTNQESTK